VSVASRESVYAYGVMRIFSLRYLRLIDVNGSPKVHGCLSGLAAHPDITIVVVISALNWRSRTYVSALPPKMPSTSPETCA
jgi:hypothetical protein